VGLEKEGKTSRKHRPKQWYHDLRTGKGASNWKGVLGGRRYSIRRGGSSRKTKLTKTPEKHSFENLLTGGKGEKVHVWRKRNTSHTSVVRGKGILGGEKKKHREREKKKTLSSLKTTRGWQRDSTENSRNSVTGEKVLQKKGGEQGSAYAGEKDRSSRRDSCERPGGVFCVWRCEGGEKILPGRLEAAWKPCVGEGMRAFKRVHGKTSSQIQEEPSGQYGSSTKQKIFEKNKTRSVITFPRDCDLKGGRTRGGGEKLPCLWWKRGRGHGKGWGSNQCIYRGVGGAS